MTFTNARVPLALAALAMVLGGVYVRSTAVAAAREAGPMRIGVNTHFGQGWGAVAWTALGQSGLPIIRDALAWRRIEAAPHHYEFNAANSGFVDRACQSGKQVSLTLEPRNPLYDNGQTAFTPAAREAFGAYARAVATQFGACLVAIEVGNEINNAANVTGPAAGDRAASHVELVRAVRDAVKPVRPDIAILGGSSLGISVGFLDGLFRAGLGSVADGLVVHPYRKYTVNLDTDLARVNAMMARYGKPLPIWATEFSENLSDDAGPAWAVQIITQMSAAGVHDADWYALLDEPQLYPNMGLFHVQGQPKPVGATVAMLARAIQANGNAVPGPAYADGLYDFQIGAQYRILWGLPRAYRVAVPGHVFDAAHNPLPDSGQIGDAPIIVEGGAAVTLGAPQVLADSLYGFGRDQWEYWAQRADAAPVQLGLIDWRWASYIGTPQFRQIVVNPLTLSPGGNRKFPIWTTLRYTADHAQPVLLQACLARQDNRGDGIQFRISVNGKVLRDLNIAGSNTAVEVPVNIAAGDQVDFAVGPGLNALGDVFRYRFRVSTMPGSPSC